MKLFEYQKNFFNEAMARITQKRYDRHKDEIDKIATYYDITNSKSANSKSNLSDDEYKECFNKPTKIPGEIWRFDGHLNGIPGTESIVYYMHSNGYTYSIPVREGKPVRVVMEGCSHDDPGRIRIEDLSQVNMEDIPARNPRGTRANTPIIDELADIIRPVVPTLRSSPQYILDRDTTLGAFTNTDNTDNTDNTERGDFYADH